MQKIQLLIKWGQFKNWGRLNWWVHILVCCQWIQIMMRQFEVCIFKVFRQALSWRWIRALCLTLLVILGHIATLRHKSYLHQFAVLLSPRSPIWWPTNSLITCCSSSPYVSPRLFVCCVLSRFSCGRLSATPWTVTPPGSSVLGFSRQEYRSGLPPPGDLLEPGIEALSHKSSAWAGRFFIISASWEAPYSVCHQVIWTRSLTAVERNR